MGNYKAKKGGPLRLLPSLVLIAFFGVLAFRLILAQPQHFFKAHTVGGGSGPPDPQFGKQMPRIGRRSDPTMPIMAPHFQFQSEWSREAELWPELTYFQNEALDRAQKREREADRERDRSGNSERYVRVWRKMMEGQQYED